MGALVLQGHLQEAGEQMPLARPRYEWFMLNSSSDPVLQANLRKAEEQVSKLDMDARNAREEADNLRRRLLNSEALAHTLEANEQRALQREKNATEQQHQLRAELEAMHKLHAEQAQVGNLGASAVQSGVQLHVICGGLMDCAVHGLCPCRQSAQAVHT